MPQPLQMGTGVSSVPPGLKRPTRHGWHVPGMLSTPWPGSHTTSPLVAAALAAGLAHCCRRGGGARRSFALSSGPSHTLAAARLRSQGVMRSSKHAFDGHLHTRVYLPRTHARVDALRAWQIEVGSAWPQRTDAQPGRRRGLTSAVVGVGAAVEGREAAERAPRARGLWYGLVATRGPGGGVAGLARGPANPGWQASGDSKGMEQPRWGVWGDGQENAVCLRVGCGATRVAG